MHCVIMTRHIGHYHDARYRGAAEAIERVTVISTANEGDFAHFLSQSGDTAPYAIERLYPGRAAYDAAVRSGMLRDKLESTLDRLAPDAIAISGWSNPESMIAIRWGRQRGARLVMMSESMADDAARSAWREAIKKRIVSQCDAALVGGPAQAAYIASLGIAPSAAQLGYNAVDNDYFRHRADDARQREAAERSRLGLPRGYILASCRFIAKKNLPALVAAYGDIAATNAEVPDLVILGDGETRPQIETAAREMRVSDRLHLPGYRGYADLPAFYALADLFVHVSTVEQWGLVINEAMACATPVLVSRPCGATRTLVEDRVSGLVVEPTRNAIAAGLGRFFALDPRARRVMGATGRIAVAEWGPRRFGSGLKAAIATAHKSAKPRPLAPWDAAILARMEKQSVETVS